MVSAIGCQMNSNTPLNQMAQKRTQSSMTTAPVASLSLTSLTFLGTPVGTAAATQTFTLTNTGNEVLSLSGSGLGISITGTNASSYSQTNTCGTSVASGASCVITVTFNPTADGTLNATVSIADNASGSPQSVTLSGTGTTLVVSVSSPASLTFASTPVGVTADAQTITLYNTGDSPLSLSGSGLGISISGASASSYSQINTCGTSVGAGGNCAITVTFNPTASGTLNATVSIAVDVSETPLTVSLSGTGILAAANSSSGTGNIYYVDNTIPDINIASATPDCTTYNPTTYLCGGGSATAYATIADINTKAFNPGDTILFRRGEIWREQLMDIKGGHMSNGSVGKPITYSAFGDSASPLPIISGTNLFSEWQLEHVGAGATAATIYYAPYQVIPSTYGNYESVNYATVPSQVFEDYKRLTQNISSVNSLAVGQWYLDTANSVIWIRLTGDDNPSGHTIEASQRDYAIELYSVSYITISNLQTQGANEDGIGLGDCDDDNVVISGVISINNYTRGIHIVNSANDTIRSSTITNNGGMGIDIQQSPNILLDGNTVHDNGQLSTMPTDNQAAGIDAGGPLTTNIIVQNNLIYSNGVAGGSAALRGIDFDTVGTGAIIRYNNIYSNTFDGIELDADNDVTVYGNIIYDNEHCGICAFADANQVITGIKIYNNTLYGNDNGIAISGPTYPPYVSGLPNGCINNTVIDNIIVNSTVGPNLQASWGCDNTGGFGSNNVYTFNMFGPESSKFILWGINQTTGRSVYESTYAAWEAAVGNCGSTGCSHSVESDPLFTSTSTNNFTLSQYSPAISAGLNLGQTYQYDINPASIWPSNVILNSQNSSGGGWTIGAYIHTYLSVINSIQ
jgi:parallel beta-helix repeat protein